MFEFESFRFAAATNGQRQPDQPKAVEARRIAIDAADVTIDDRVLELFHRCQWALREGGRHIVIDLHAVTRADTKIIACLVALYQMARAASARLEVRLSQAIVDIARICRLDVLVGEWSMIAGVDTIDTTRPSCA